MGSSPHTPNIDQTQMRRLWAPFLLKLKLINPIVNWIDLRSMEDNNFDIWDFITHQSLKKKYENYDATYDLSFDELQLITNISNNGTYEYNNGKIFTVEANARQMIIHLPHSVVQGANKYPLLIFFHGLGDHPWDCALHKTNWRELSNKHQFILGFGWGTNCGCTFDPRCGFNIKDPVEDLKYLNNMIKLIITKYNVDKEKIYFVGFSNGGIFSSIVAQIYGNQLFAGIVNIMGGFGQNCAEVKQLSIFNPLPVLIITGTNDDYLTSCEYAHEYFKLHGYDSKITVLHDFGHTYPINEEENIWNFLSQKIRNDH